VAGILMVARNAREPEATTWGGGWPRRPAPITKFLVFGDKKFCSLPLAGWTEAWWAGIIVAL